MSLTATSATITGNITATTLDANDGTLANLDIDGTLTLAVGGSIVAGGTTLNSSGLSAGSGNVTIDSDGLTLTSGAIGSSRVKFSSGSYLEDVSGALWLKGGSRVGLNSTDYSVRLENSIPGFVPGETGISLGQSGGAWGDLYVALAADSGTPVEITAANRIVKNTSSRRHKEKIKTWQPT